ERQLAGNNQGALEKIVYIIASGTGKIRGAKSGGIQTVHQWRTVALATGEEPLSTETSQTGVSTRVLEIYGGRSTTNRTPPSCTSRPLWTAGGQAPPSLSTSSRWMSGRSWNVTRICSGISGRPAR